MKESIRELWSVVGYDAKAGLLIVEEPNTGERIGIYMSTGAEMMLPLEYTDWVRDENGKQLPEPQVVEKVEYIDPPKRIKDLI